MQTILGAGGAIGKALAVALRSYTEDIRLVSRNPEKVNETDQLRAADLNNPTQTLEAVEGSDVVYLTAGLPYSYAVWKECWPRIMTNVLDACRTHGAKLVFFDNVYMYDASTMDPMTEAHPILPCSKKGAIREQIANMLLKAVEEGKIQALIARSADFYGPGAGPVSVLSETVFKPLSQGKKANWMGDATKKHSFTFVPDAAKATALLGNTDDAYGQVWHLPTAKDPYTGEGYIREIAHHLGVKPRYRTAGKTLVRILGIFSPLMRELGEMLYQYDRDYVFDSSKFEKTFNMHPTPYEEGIRQVIAHDYPTKSPR